MPPLKWERIMVRDTGRGSNADIVLSEGLSPIELLSNGYFGIDGFPYAIRSPIIPQANHPIGFDYGNNSAITGPGGTCLIDSSTSVDSNGNVGHIRYQPAAIQAANPFYAVFKGAVGTRIATFNTGGIMAGLFAEANATETVGIADVDYNATWKLPCHVVSSPVGFVSGNPSPTPPFLVFPSSALGISVSAVEGYPRTVTPGPWAVTAFSQSVPITAATLTPPVGSFILYKSATNWFLTRVIANPSSVPTTAANTIYVDPEPKISFNATSYTVYPMWGAFDTVPGLNSTDDVHASAATTGVYFGSQCVTYFQGRVLAANVYYRAKYAVAADKNFYVRKSNRLIYSILQGEQPSRGTWTTNSDGLTHFQFPWNIEPGNYIDVENVGDILGMANLGDNQVFIMGSTGCARLTGYLTTILPDVDGSTFDLRPIAGSPGLAWPNAYVVTRKGVFFAGRDSIYLYDGSNIQDVMSGSIKKYYVTTNGFPFNLGAVYGGSLNDDLIYFAGRSVNSTTNEPDGGFLLNIETGKWSMFGRFTASDYEIPYPTVVPNNFWVYAKLSGTNKKHFGSFVDINNSFTAQYIQDGHVPSYITAPKFRVNLPSAGGNTSPGNIESGFGQDWGRYVLALRPVGAPGTARRFLHVVINYGFIATTTLCRVHAIFGAEYGWPIVPNSAALLIGTLPAIASSATYRGGELPNQTATFHLSQSNLQDPKQGASAVMGWADSLMILFEIQFLDNYAFKVYNVDVSYIERPQGRGVMVAA